MQIQAADYPLQVEPAQVLGFDCGLGAGLRICIFFGNKTQKPPQNIGFEAVFITFQAIIYLAFYINRVSNVGKALLLICFAFSP